MDKKAAKEVQKAKISLLLREKFFGNLLTFLKVSEDPTVPTMGTDGDNLIYNPKFVNQLSRQELLGVLAHEVMHCVFKHHLYRESRDPTLWNYAGDYVINPIIMDAKFTLPAGGLFDRRFKGMSTVQVYNILAKENPPMKNLEGTGDGSGDGKGNQNSKGDGSGDGKGDQNSKGNPSNSPGKDPKSGKQPSCGEVFDTKDPLNEDNTAAKERAWNQRAAQAVASAKLAGSVPGGLLREITAILEPKVSWRAVLWQFVQQIARDDYSFMRPNSRYSGHGFCLPSLYSQKVDDIVVAIDTSGSISQDDINQFASEISEIQQTTKANIRVLYCDTRVAHDEKFEPGDFIKLHPKGGGGTDFRPVFKWVAEKQIELCCLIYLTDGYCSSFPREEPEYPTLWITDRDRWEPPFGDVVSL